jgi:hypothetical protein
LGGGSVAVGGGVSADHAVDAELLVAAQAVDTLAAGVDHAADAYPGADLVAGDPGTDFSDDPDDFVARDDGIGLGSPVAVDGVDIGVADARELDLNEDVVGSDCAPLDGREGERLPASGAAYAFTLMRVLPVVASRGWLLGSGHRHAVALGVGHWFRRVRDCGDLVAFVDGEVHHQSVQGRVVPVLFVPGSGHARVRTGLTSAC